MSNIGTLEDDDDDYYVPLVDQRIFGAGIKRKRVAFVPASSSATTVKPVSSSPDAGNRYLSIVLPETVKGDTRTIDALKEDQDESTRHDADSEPVLQVGTLPNTSIAHQLNTGHSHPPSHIDRTRLGMKYLQEYGWDPDARQGLGSRHQGIRIPVKANQKSDTAGLGLFTKEDGDWSGSKKKVARKASLVDTVKLNAKQVRKSEGDKRARGEKLRQKLYGEDLTQYLGPED